MPVAIRTAWTVDGPRADVFSCEALPRTGLEAVREGGLQASSPSEGAMD